MAKKTLLDGISEKQHGLANSLADIKACTTMSQDDVFYIIYGGEFITFQYDDDATDTATVAAHPYVLEPDTGPGRCEGS